MTLTTITVPTADFVTTSLNGAIAADVTEATIGTGLNLAATNGVLQIDNDSTEAVGDPSGPETITYTAYTTATGALTGITRGAAGTTGVTHGNGASVICAPSTLLWNNLSGIVGQTAWAAWTPTWTNVTVGNGTVTAKYLQIGKMVWFRLSFVLGSTSAIAGTASFTLPVTSVSHAGTASTQPIGKVMLVDTGTNQLLGTLTWASTTTARISWDDVDASNVIRTAISATVPFTWAATDEINCEGFFESA